MESCDDPTRPGIDDCRLPIDERHAADVQSPPVLQSAIIDHHSAILPMPTPRELLDRLDSRHDELIRKLDELNAQIETALAQFGKSRSATDQPLDVLSDAAAADAARVRRAA
jgi:hypothetical protein